jgi:branched-chain amino acid transport system permease protein
VVLAVVRRLARAPFGQALLALRDDEIAAWQAGKNVRLLRLQAFLLGAAISGISGALYVWYTNVASPEMFSADITFTVFIALVLGGIGSNVGAIFGACLLVGLQEVLRTFATNPLIAERTGAVQAAVEGLLLVLLLRLAPGGIAELITRARRRRKASTHPLDAPVDGAIPVDKEYVS